MQISENPETPSDSSQTSHLSSLKARSAGSITDAGVMLFLYKISSSGIFTVPFDV